MRTRFLAAAFPLAIAVFAATGPSRAAEPKDGVPLFDGKSFAGWEGNLKHFRIEDRAIVGGTLKEKIPRNEFLCTEKEYGDFELRLKFKVLGKGANAGVQLRSQRIPNHHEVKGYQADLGDGWWGCLYDEAAPQQDPGSGRCQGCRQDTQARRLERLRQSVAKASTSSFGSTAKRPSTTPKRTTRSRNGA